MKLVSIVLGIIAGITAYIVALVYGVHGYMPHFGDVGYSSVLKPENLRIWVMERPSSNLRLTILRNSFDNRREWGEDTNGDGRWDRIGVCSSLGRGAFYFGCYTVRMGDPNIDPRLRPYIAPTIQLLDRATREAMRPKPKPCCCRT